MITIKDPGQTLSQTQADILIAKAAAYPFDLHVLIGTGGTSRAEFEQQVAGYVPAGTHTVSIGVDPVLHFTYVRSSASLGVPPGPQVAQAGNSYFRSGNLVEGIDAIAAKADQLKVAPVAAQQFVPGPDQKLLESQSGVPIVIQENHTSSAVWWGTGAFVATVTAIVCYVVWRTRKAREAAVKAEETLTIEAAEYAAKNVEVSRHYDLIESRQKQFDPPAQATSNIVDKGYVPFSSAAAGLSEAQYNRVLARSAAAARQSVVVVDNGRSPALDMLVGYELGRVSAQQVYVPPAPFVERAPEVSTPSSSFWSSSSDSDSSSSYSSSSDSSSSSSWDSGSSFDSGSSGGGSDW